MDTTELKQRASAIIAVNRQGSTDAPDPDAVDSMLADAVSLAESALALLRGFENGAITHFPFIGKNGQVGLRNVHSDGRVEFLYLNPSAYDEEGGPSATEGCSVFLYQGTEGEPEDDTPQHFYYIFNPADWEEPDGVNQT